MSPMSRKRSRSYSPRGPIQVPGAGPWCGFWRGYIPRGWVMHPTPIWRVRGFGWWLLVIVACPIVLILLAAFFALLSSLLR